MELDASVYMLASAEMIRAEHLALRDAGEVSSEASSSGGIENVVYSLGHGNLSRLEGFKA
eukprot:5219909-Amphidinium_carterae.1